MARFRAIASTFDEISRWRKGWFNYIERHVTTSAKSFEQHKDMVVDILMARRGMYQRPFMHFSVGVLFVAGIVSGPILADTYPGRNNSQVLDSFVPPSAVVTSLDLTEYGVKTQVSEKPRDQVIDYSVEEGDTLSTIANKFGISTDSVRWSNTLNRDMLQVGQVLKIPPVTGVVHKVREGETIYSIAKRYGTEAQKIVNYPFNDFANLETFALNVGQTLIVPDGEVAPVATQRPTTPRTGSTTVQPPVSAGGSGQLSWPAGGQITQYPIWYHMALDIANREAPGIAVAADGVVTSVQYLKYGYGQHVIVDHGGGMSTLYAHLSEIYVKPGDKLSRGQILGKMGSTGRSTGIHLHFEVRINGVAKSPLGYLK